MINGINCGGGAAPDFDAIRERRFSKIDQDGDGKITKDELSAAAPKNGNGPDVDAIFSKVDTNRDGVIDNDEDKAAFEAMRAHHPDRHQGAPDPAKIASAIFEKADSDADGKITKEELGALLSKGDKSDLAEKVFSEVDADDDGSITQAELEDSLKQMFEKIRDHRHKHEYDNSGTTTDSGSTADSSESFSAVA